MTSSGPLIIVALVLFCHQAVCFSPSLFGSVVPCSEAAARGTSAGRATATGSRGGGRGNGMSGTTATRCSDREGDGDASRRAFIRTLAAASLLVLPPAEGKAAEAQAAGGGEWRKYTALAPLGAADATVGGDKRTGMGLDELASVLARDVEKGATGKGGYFISGDLSPEVFKDDCRFVDPTNDVSSLSRYKTALGILFDPAESKVELLTRPRVDAARRTIEAEVRSSGVLKLPWRPYIKPYKTRIVWSIGQDGLVYQQAQTWDISAADALFQSFNPFGSKKP